MGALHSEQWQRLYQQKSHSFLEERCYSASRVTDLAKLQESFSDMGNQYKLQRFSDIVQAFQPSLENLKLFTLAIFSATQDVAVTGLVWGAVQAVVESACRCPDMLDEVFVLLSELNNTLPQLREEKDLIPKQPNLQWSLQDLYEDQIDYCITVVRYLRKKSSMSILKSFWISTPRQNFQATRSSIQKHFQDFEAEAETCAQTSARQLGYELAKDLQIQPSSDSNHLQRNDEAGVTFPIRTGIPSRNYTFVGREDILRELYGNLHRTSSGPGCCVLYGLGGVGKTETALEFTYMHRKDYDAVFWLPAERVPDLEAAFAQIAISLGLATHDEYEDHKKANVVIARKWLEDTSRRWLIVFDNMEDVYDLDPFFPKSTNANSSILLTTQMSEITPITENFSRFQLKSFKQADASKLLFRCLDRVPNDEDEEEAAKQVSGNVDGLPLAIATIGGYIQQSEISIPEFLDNLKRSSNVWEASAVGPAKRYEKTLETVFDIALNELDISACKFINVLAFLNPDGIPEDIFTAHFKKPLYNFARSRDELTELTRVLRRRQLVKREISTSVGPYLTIHRSLQWNILLHLSRDRDERWNVFHQALTFLRRGMPMTSPLDIPEPEKWPQFQKYVPQVLNLRTHCLWPEPPVELPVGFAEVLSDLATYMWHAGLASDGHDALGTAIKIMDDEDVENDDPRRGDVYAKLGILISYNGVSDRREALELRMKAWDVRHKEFSAKAPNEVTRNDEIRLFNVKCDLAWTYLHEGRDAEAEPIMNECLIKYKQWDTEENIPFEYAKYFTLMSVIRMTEGREDIAVDFAKRGADLITKAAGAEHPVTQNWRFILGVVVFHTGAVAKSLEINEEILRIRKKVIGEFNHFTLESYSTCAALLLRLDRPQNAKDLLTKCLERRKCAVWNPEGVARAQYRLSKVLQKLGDEDDANKFGREATRTKEWFLKEYADKLKDDPDEEVVFDRMVSVWHGRLTKDIRSDATST